MAHELQTSFAPMVDDALRATLVTVETGVEGVMVPVFNTKYEGVPASGSVKIPYRADMVVGAYNKATGIAATVGSTAYITVTDFEDVAVNEIVDGYDVEAVPDDLIADRLASAGYAGALALDQDGINTLVAEGTESTDTAKSDSTTAYKKANAARATLSKNKVPTGGRYLLASPDFYSALLEDKDNFVKAGDMGQAIAQNGFVGKVAGFFVIECPALPADVEFICGHSNWCTRVRAWVKTPDVYSLDGDAAYVGASAIKGRWVYKHKVTKAAAVLVKTFVAG